MAAPWPLVFAAALGLIVGGALDHVAGWLGRDGGGVWPAAGASPLLTGGAGAALGLWAGSVVPAPVLGWACGLGWGLLVLALVDLRCWRLPDALTLPLLAGGLLFAAVVVPGTLADHVIGAAAGYGVIALAGLAYRTLRGRDGLGWGDAKLLAAGGAWVGWAGLGGILFIAAVAALLAVFAFRLRGGAVTADTALPFGPALALGIWLSFLHGPLLIG
ncbi:prepilin peptidase [Zavarzinia aquatilis]|uniref:Prepilin peptidase n=1 Tax=Zavarzinia aquatilis TaxID=2211142 RepID=A0A317EE97_9PROT|nr:A24 family peptidase [Zavarzinia aquatilis]PWR25357.1 prepilin peptidase [Zavarzinia aquatilis]